MYTAVMKTSKQIQIADLLQDAKILDISLLKEGQNRNAWISEA